MQASHAVCMAPLAEAFDRVFFARAEADGVQRISGEICEMFYIGDPIEVSSMHDGSCDAFVFSGAGTGAPGVVLLAGGW